MKLCACGCGQEIKIKKHHKYYGIPNYIKGHNTKGKSLSEKAKLKLSQNAEINPNYGMKGKHHSLKIVYLYAEVVIQKRIQIAKLAWTIFFQELLKERYSYEYTQDQKIILNYMEK